MKTRQAFVSNSSTSSFCIYGVALEKPDDAAVLYNWLLKFEEAYSEKFQEIVSDIKKQQSKYRDDVSFFDKLKDIRIIDKQQFLEAFEKEYCGEFYEMYELIRSFINPYDLEMEIPCEYETIYIGRSWSSVRDNETGAEFKKIIERKINKLFGEHKCETHTEAWRN